MGADYHPAPIKYAWQHQPDAVLDQANPVQNTWYTVLAATEDIRIISFGAYVEDTGETIEGRIVIDGVTIMVDPLAFAAATVLETVNNNPALPSFQWMAGATAYRAFFIEGQNIAISIRKITANGVGILHGLVKRARLLPT
jgi:hypothetical protein